MALDPVAEGAPHVASHNDERSAINAFEALVETGRLSEDALQTLIQGMIDAAMTPTEPMAMRFADLEDVSLGTVTDSSVARYDSVEEVWTASPGYDLDAKNFRGDWQDPAATLLWSSDFATQAEVDQFIFSLASGTAFTSNSKTSVLTANSGETLSSHERAALLVATTNASSAAVSVGNFTLDPSLIPALAGKFIASVSFWRRARIAPGAASNPSVRIREYAGATLLETAVTRDATAANTEVVSPWTQKTYPIGAVNQSFIVQLEDYGSSNATVPLQFYLTGLQFFGAADAEDLYALGDVVAHDGSYWRSLYDNNTHTPVDGSGYWYRIPPAS